MQEFTMEEISRYNGSNGEKVYVVYEGQVYDITESEFWESGSHMGLHEAGKDLTDDLNLEAPHESDALKKYPVVGILKK